MELKENPEFNIDKIYNLILSLYNDKFLDENLNIENNTNIEEDNDYENIEFDDIINKTDKINLNDSFHGY